MSTDILDLMRVPTLPDVYVLGCFGRYITLYSQQVRAINLAYSLNKRNPLKDKRVVVIGAGAAGITFATAAARVGAAVTLLEKLPHIMGIQRGSTKRFVHPHIYDWPVGNFRQQRAALPFLDWVADYADKVVSQIERKWKNELHFIKDNVDMRWEVHDVGIESNTLSSKCTVTWNDKFGPHGEEFDIVILAVGFGREVDHDKSQPRYWEDDRLAKVDEIRKVCLISGCGDGGLTDLMQLCLRDFRHEYVIEEWAQDSEAKKLGEKLRLTEEHCFQIDDHSASREFLKNLDIRAMQEFLRNNLRSDTDVYLTARSWNDVYGPKSCILNRIIASQLAKIGAWKFKQGPIDLPDTRKPNGRYRISFGQDQKTFREFDILVVRHGPESVIGTEFPTIFEKCAKLIDKWRTIPHHADVTRQAIDWSDTFQERGTGWQLGPRRELRKPVRLVAFDLDRTLLQEDQYTWSWKLVWQHLKYDDIVRAELMNHYLNVEKHSNPTWYQDWCNESAVLFRERQLKRSDFVQITECLTLVDGFADVIKRLKDSGIVLALVSGGIDTFLEEKIPDHQSIFDYIFINRFIFDEAGLFKRIESTPYDFEGKWTAIQTICKERGFSSEQVVFVGDGFNDEYVLGHAGKSICFNASGERMASNADANIDGRDLRDILPEIF